MLVARGGDGERGRARQRKERERGRAHGENSTKDAFMLYSLATSHPLALPMIRPCEPADVPAVQAIYAHHVATSLATFDEVAPSVDEMSARLREVAGGGFPFVVGEIDGRVAGYGYASPFRARAAYRFTCENSVYIAPEMLRRGVGQAIMREVIDACRRRGLRQMLAVIGDSGNAASIGLHSRLGFEHTGIFRDVGFKFGRWVDVVLMQLDLTRS
jgi:phosphinothricin acetyltransferase